MRNVSLAKVFLLLGLVVFQAQAFASDALRCRHALDADSGAATTGCPFHAPASGSGSLAEDPLDCHKCALHLGVLCPLQVPAAPVVTLMPIRPVTESVPATHFYRFTPESPLRPPIAPLT
jgi:hypothetical protein